VSAVPERHGPSEADMWPVLQTAEHNVVELRHRPSQTGDTTTGGGGRSSWWPPLLLSWLGLVVLALVLTGKSGVLRSALVIGYVMTVPGLACIRLLFLPDRLVQLVFGVGLSLALAVLVAQAMMYLEMWSPVRGMAILVVIGSLASCGELIARTSHRVAAALPGRWLSR
jgi:hypothetical protein